MKQTLKMHFMTLLMLRYVQCRRAQEVIDTFYFLDPLYTITGFDYPA